MKITSFEVSEDSSVILLNVDNAGAATNLHLWTKETYKIDEYKIDLSGKLTGQFSQSIIITPGDIGASHFDGVYIIDIVGSEGTVCAIAAELTRYKECILEKVLAYQDCDSCLEINYPQVLNAQTLLYTIEKSIELNLVQEVLIMIFALDKFCTNDCKGCGEYKNI